MNQPKTKQEAQAAIDVKTYMADSLEARMREFKSTSLRRAAEALVRERRSQIKALQAALPTLPDAL